MVRRSINLMVRIVERRGERGTGRRREGEKIGEEERK